MSLGLLLVPALGGYWFLTHLHFTRYQVARVSGYHVLFRSALVGGALFVIAEAGLLLLNQWVPQFRMEWESLFPVAYSDTVVLSVVLGAVLPLAVNLVYSAQRAAQKVARDGGDLVELLIDESIEDQKLVEISLRSGKTYIGFAVLLHLLGRPIGEPARGQGIEKPTAAVTSMPHCGIESCSSWH